MATLLGRQEFDSRVEFRGFPFQESDDSVATVPGRLSVGRVLQAHTLRFDLFGAGHTHTAAVTARVWDSRPDTEAGDWDEPAEIVYESVTGDVAVPTRSSLWGAGSR
ncbi:hypothetical protein [Streptomyces virginiae]|uniref:hypothetical protein n=1 Tax=Streptomyces virginiae TaxID=1961 RepID=UPI0036B42347